MGNAEREISTLSLFEASPRPEILHISIGFFDGVHRGHQEVLRQLLSLSSDPAACAVLTFEPHPLVVIRPEQAPPRLTTPEQKIRLLAAAGPRFVLVIHFDQRVRETSPEEFLGQIARIFPNLQTIVVGKDFRFGRDAAGDVQTLREIGSKRGFAVRIVPPLLDGGQRVASSRIREALLQRRFEDAERWLGRSYSIIGRVTSGSGIGHRLGSPTANLGGITQLLPPEGVYACRVRIPEEFPAVANYGRRPTFGSDPDPLLEVHLLDFSGDLSGAEVEVTDWYFLREEKRFDNVPELRAQIAADIAAARNHFAQIR
ncbi:riboflavin kinase / FMN adenylyltransferase [Methylacidimicrobium cyclopophantes]|uniref:Riboflavin biosynthesis protein n=1 Tax=Methylacidimicrobium cyclopophantes TaxID=1041766 RepID=A0A5E6MGB2_9BACT|nr:bifunctional riboflavin kinase/FAD synthetase [Methylacidimicrobium cyclopophantes]VVM06903.1 riboflavin kinase / FMN adenylyltransferase [Methylacidimicrobium cyclopophantes]